MKKTEKSKKSRKKVPFKSVTDYIFDDDVDNLRNRNTFTIFEVIIIVLISILFGIIIGYIITYSRNPISGGKSNVNISEIVNTYNSIVDSYYDKVDENKLTDAAIKGMIESLEDPYSNYMDTNTTDSFNETVDGSFVGIGVTVIFEDGYNTIIDIIKDSPAAKSGLKVNDVIVKIGGKDIKDISGEKLTKLIKGKIGTKVRITVKRDGKEKDFLVKRDNIEIECVSNTVFDYEGKNVGYIKIDSFAANSYKQFKKAINRLDDKKIDYLVIDVRDNPGGHLQQTREILSLFFNKKTILYQIQTKGNTEKIYSLNGIVKKYPVAVLINNGSASASEILASCFQENYKNSLIVGEKSYGKGTVQKSQSLSSGNSIKFTTQKWLTSKGKWLGEVGVQPDVEVFAPDEYYTDHSYNNDLQLQEALKKLKESN